MSPQASRREFLRIAAAAVASATVGFSQTLPVLRNIPYVQNVRRNRATVCWTGPEAAAGMVEFWDDSRVARTVQASVRDIATGQRQSEAVLEGLAPGATYTYRVTSNGQLLTPQLQSFQTPGDSGFTFVAFGDSGVGSPAQAELAKRMLTSGAQFVLHTGDLVYPAGTYEGYQALHFAYYQDLMRVAPFFPCPGNHDYWETNSLPYRALHSLPSETIPAKDQGRYYSFDWGNAHFVSLDTNETLTLAANGNGEMLKWLDADLAASHKFWRIVLMHHPPYASGVHDGESEAALIRRFIAPILDRHDVPLVLNGHEHSYQRSKPIRDSQVQTGGTIYVTSGGGGAPLQPVKPSQLIETAASQYHYLHCVVDGGTLRMEVRKLDGSPLETWSLIPKPVLSAQPVVDAASFGEDLAAGGVISIFGKQLATSEMHPTQYPLPREQAGCSVTLNGEALPLLMVSATQINVQLPYKPGRAELVIHTPNGTVMRNIRVLKTAPAVFEGAIFRQTGEQVCGTCPARSGDVLSVFATGLGVPQGAHAIGDAATPLPVAAKVQVDWNGSILTAQTATLAPGMCGVYVVTFAVPQSAEGSSSDAKLRLAQLRIVAGPRRSPAVTVSAA